MDINKRGSFSLSINAIVILIIAIAVLGIILGFVTKNIQSAANRLESYAIEDCRVNPSASEPLVLDPENVKMKPGGTRPVCVGLYNDPAAYKASQTDDKYCCIYVIDSNGIQLKENDGYIYNDNWILKNKGDSLKSIILVKGTQGIYNVDVVGRCYVGYVQAKCKDWVKDMPIEETKSLTIQTI